MKKKKRIGPSAFFLVASRRGGAMLWQKRNAAQRGLRAFCAAVVFVRDLSHDGSVAVGAYADNLDGSL